MCTKQKLQKREYVRVRQIWGQPLKQFRLAAAARRTVVSSEKIRPNQVLLMWFLGIFSNFSMQASSDSLDFCFRSIAIVKSLQWHVCFSQFHGFFNLIFWRVFAIWPNCAASTAAGRGAASNAAGRGGGAVVAPTHRTSPRRAPHYVFLLLRSQGSHHLRVSRAISRKIRQLSSIARPSKQAAVPDVIWRNFVFLAPKISCVNLTIC